MSRRVRRRRPAAQPDATPRKWRLQPLALLPAVLAIAGMLLFAYPTVAAWVTQYNQSKIITSYDADVDTANPEAAVQLAQAHAYNDALSSGAVLEANTNIPTGAGSGGDDALDYNSILDANGAGLMARLRIPAIDLDLPIYHGTSDETLLAGLGHLEGTSLPVGGVGTRSVITGHRGLADARMFTDLNRVEEGDKFIIEVFGEVLTYQVIDTKVVEPDETEALRAQEDRDLVTLVTCTPLGINTHRILVTGERIYPTPQEDLDAAGQAPTVPSFPWWALGLAAGFILVGVYVWRSGYSGGRRRAAPRSRDAAASADAEDSGSS
ncbi:class C sortase [Actinomyces sp. MRS3W]|uniref:class C sortase n=1 Tax=Actinomyces sp. MRS3W TaxID=2800796 RepID=UPI0028FD3D0E|nr:class C sortase [Actinomyces sp. MRS3W]MDU0348889.1 class C sortase [Actinomyces sp. MRS3W]